MNIFYLDRDVESCASAHVDRHVVKMITEYNQLLCTAINLSGGEAPYKTTHKNHPCAVWVRESKANWEYLKSLTIALCSEYTKRYGRVHAGENIVRSLSCPSLEDKSWTEPPQAMPEEFKKGDPVEAYREYYRKGKAHLAKWKNTNEPAWFNN